ncbi:MAG: single-stranded DNA-binding protein [Sedimentisphaerales bacterium]|nr:single-stranded DNA-binding protein [Sedimentisphaerales bacterium]
MANFNKVFLMGNLTRDPQLSYLPSQTAVVDFGLAVNRRWTGQNGQAKEETCFVDCRAFGRLAENINKYLSKGRPLFVEGRLTFDSWTAQDGTKRSKHRVTIENFQFLPGTAPATTKQSSGMEKSAEQTAVPDYGDSAPAPEKQTGADDIPF